MNFQKIKNMGVRKMGDVFEGVQRMPQKEKNIYFSVVGVFLFGAVWFFGIAPVLPVGDPFHHSATMCRIDAYGASKTDPTKTREAFAQAFAECAPGGTVVVPWGTWVTGGITIPSDVTLYLNVGSVLSFSDSPSQYLPVVPTRWEGMDVMNYQPLVYVPNAHNVAIIGRGQMMGNGDKWWGWREGSLGYQEKSSAKELYEMAKEGKPLEERAFGKITKPLRPSFLQTYQSDGVVVEGITIGDGPMWTIHPVYSKNITIRNVTVNSTGPNTDGIAIDSSENVLVSGCTIGSGDDAIVIKSGLDYDGWKQNRPSQHIVIENSRVVRGNAGVTIGSEMSGGVEDVLVRNMRLGYVDTGIRLKTLKGRGGYVKNIRYENITMRNLTEDVVQLDMKYKYATLKSENKALPAVSDISLKNIFATGTNRALRVEGLEGSPIKNFSIEDSSFSVVEAGVVNNTAGTVFNNVGITAKDIHSLSVKGASDMTLAGYFPRGGRGLAFAEFEGSKIKNISVSLWPCPKQRCVSGDKKVPSGQVVFQ